jgi:ABC-type bacteriocin/lantibiotic exporter with double-glycine peptidase domain
MIHNIRSILKEFLYEHKFYFIVYIILIILNYPFDNIVIPRIYSSFFDAISLKPNKNSIYLKYGFIFVLALSLINISGYFIDIIQSHITPELEMYLKNKIFTYILKNNESNYSQISTAEFINTYEQIPHSILTFIIYFMKYVLPEIITLCVINIYFYFINWRLGFVTSMILIIYIYYYKSYLHKCMKKNKNKTKQSLIIKKKIEDKITNIFSIYSNGKLNDEIEKNKEINLKNNTIIKDSLKCDNNITFFNDNYTILLFVVLNGVSIYLFKKNIINHTILLALLFTIMFLPRCINTLSWSLPELKEYYIQLVDNNEIIKNLSEYNDKKNNDNKLHINDGHIIMRNVYFSYNNDTRYLIHNLNLEIKPQQKVALLGDSGNGKSTIIKLLTGYYKIQKGEIVIDSQNIYDYDINNIRQNISYVGQNNTLFNTTILENIQYGNNMSKYDIENIIQSINIREIFMNLPHGLDTYVGVNGDKLSGGQKQIIHILRCIFKNNKIVILDEPTSSIDIHHKEYVINAIKKLSENKTLILITHDKELLELVDRKIYIKNGIIIKDTDR